MSHGRVVLRHIREKSVEKRPDDPGEKIYSARFLPNIHEAQEECHDTDESDRDLHAGIGGIKNAVNDGFENLRITHHQPRRGGQKSKQEEKDP